jgi:hypothetical protein
MLEWLKFAEMNALHKAGAAMKGRRNRSAIWKTVGFFLGGAVAKRVLIGLALTGVVLTVAAAVGYLASSTNSEDLPSRLLSQVGDNSARTDTVGEALPIPQSPTALAASPDPSKALVLQEFTAAAGSEARHEGKYSPRWSWLSSDDTGEVTWTAEEAFEKATQYVLGEQPTQREALRHYQRVLATDAPRELELHVKLTMGARMTILYNPDLGEDSLDDEAIRWYEQIVDDFNDWDNHHDLIVAKIHLGDLYCMRNHGLAEVQKATDLCWQVIGVPKEEIVFDNPEYDGFNMDSILSAKAPGRFISSDGKPMEPPESANERHREFLLRQREEQTDRLRLAAIRSLAYKQQIPAFPVEVAIERLLQFKQERPDDQLYQDTLSGIIEDFREEHQSHIDALFDETLDAIEDVP